MADKNETENGNFIEPAPMRWTLRIIFIIVFVVGIIGNSVVCMAVIRRKRMRTSNNIFTFNLAFSDLLNVVIYLPSQMAAFENDQNWALGSFMCHFTYILVPLCLSASIGTLLAITCDRYRAIAYPMKPRLSGKKVKIILAVIWTSSFLICCPLTFVAGLTYPAPGKVFCDETWPDALYSKIYWNFIFVIQYFLPLTMIAVLAVLIAVKIRQNSAMKLLPKSSQVVAAAVRQRMKQTAKITNMLIALVILYAICMLPQHVVFLWSTYGDLRSSKYYVYLLRFSNVFPMANSALNPIAYGTLNKEFKTVFKNFFNCKCHKADMEDIARTNALQRSGKFRLAVYKHSNDHNIDSHDGRWRRKSSATSLISQISTRNRARREKKYVNKENNNQELTANGYVAKSTTITSSSDANDEIKTRELDGKEFSLQQGESVGENFELKTAPVNDSTREDGEESINGGSKIHLKSLRSNDVSPNGNMAKRDAEKEERKVNKASSRKRKETEDEVGLEIACDNNDLNSDHDVRRRLLTSKDGKCSLVDCWLDSHRTINKVDEAMFRYIRTLKETDL